MGRVVNTTPWSFTPKKETQYPLYSRLDRPQGLSGWVQKISPPLGLDPPTCPAVACCYTNYTIPAHPEYGGVCEITVEVRKAL
jgi:hypothetical protein